MPLDESDEFEVVVVLAERVDERLGDLEPADVEEELEEREHGHVQVDDLVGVHRVQELLADHGEQEERVDRDGHNLCGRGRREGDGSRGRALA